MQLGEASTTETLMEATVALVYHMCGADTARRLLPLRTVDQVVSVAAQDTKALPPSEAAKWMVVIGDVLDSKRDLLLHLLQVVPHATPVIFTTRAESVASMLGSAAQVVRIDALPDDDAKLVLSKALRRPATTGADPFSPKETWVGRLLRMVQCHALSLWLVGRMIAERGAAYANVLAALENKQLMQPDFVLPKGGLSQLGSVRATLDTSFELLLDELSQSAFKELGVLPTNANVWLNVLTRVWQLQHKAASAPGEHPGGRGDGRVARAAAHADVDGLVDKLVRAGLVSREVHPSNGALEGIIVHPVVREYAQALLGDNCSTMHGLLIDDYMAEVHKCGSDEYGWQSYPFWRSLNSGDDNCRVRNVSRHAAASGRIAALVSLMNENWINARVRICSPQAYQEDIETVLASLCSHVHSKNEVQVPAQLAWACRALATAFMRRIVGNWAANMEKAIAYLKRVLQVWTRDASPLSWAMAMDHLGTAHKIRVSGDSETNSEEAITCYKLALEVWTPQATPMDWATTQNNLGIAYKSRVYGDEAANMDLAIMCFERSLEVQTEDATPFVWATTQMNLGGLHCDCKSGNKAVNKKKAMACFQRALEVYTQEAAPLDWAAMEYNLGCLYNKGVSDDEAADVEEAIACYMRALEVRTLDATPLEWALTQYNLGNTYGDRVRGHEETNVDRTILCYKRALKMWTPKATPLNWAMTQTNMGSA